MPSGGHFKSLGEHTRILQDELQSHAGICTQPGMSL